MGGDVAPDNLFNVFESIAYDSFEGLDGYRRRFLKAGAASVHLAGSGPSLFTIIKEKTQAEKIYTGLKKQRLKAYLVETLDNIESII
jgi:4-diphosphocytidyl-2-C-methyl-D-erythritol kinase